MNNPHVLQCRGLVKSYRQGPEQLEVLRGINFDVRAGERVAIIGQSGSGKTTLLNMLGGLDAPSAGQVLVRGEDIAAMNEAARSRLRNASQGFVYQFHHLLGEFSAQENAAMPLLIAGQRRAEAMQRAADLLEQLGLAERLQHRPSELSGGERQRVAIARALANRPDCVLMDEPTGNLDHETAAQIEALLVELNETFNTSVVMVTHDRDLAAKMGRVVVLEDGLIHEQ